MNKNHKRISKMMSLILRHNPGVIQATLDKNGWLAVDTLISGIQSKGISMDEALLHEIVETNDKKRFSLSEDGNYIRANQGHSLNVDVELKQADPPEFLYHGTVDKFMANIRAEGLKKLNRQHVHLSKDKETATNVGSRRGKPVILCIRAGDMNRNGTTFYLSENGVWLTDQVLPEYIE